MTLPPWEYFFLAFRRENFPDIYDATWIASLVVTLAFIVAYNVRTRQLHRHPPLLDMYEWLLWTGVITFLLVATGALFLFDFFIVLSTLLIGLVALIWIRFRRFPPILATYEQKLTKQRYFSKAKYAKPESTIRPKPARRNRRRR